MAETGHARSERAVHKLPSDAAARLVAEPASPLVGAPVTIRVEGTAPPRVITVRFHTPGSHMVRVKLGSGSETRTLSLSIAVQPRPHSAPAAPHGHSAPAAAPQGHRTSSPPRPRAADPPRARIAGDPGVTIVDFQYNPSSITIHTGDTITWTNTGSQPHTATANDHSFDTGILNKGQSGSHTFSQAGTFSYFCTVHPFMKATVTVVGSGSSGGGGSGSGGGSSSGSGSSSSGAGTSSGTATGSGSSASSGSGGSLPFTGFNLVAAALCGLLLIGSGALLRLWARRGGQSPHPET